jgi:hypothetical protein
MIQCANTISKPHLRNRMSLDRPAASLWVVRDADPLSRNDIEVAGESSGLKEGWYGNYKAADGCREETRQQVLVMYFDGAHWLATHRAGQQHWVTFQHCVISYTLPSPSFPVFSGVGLLQMISHVVHWPAGRVLNVCTTYPQTFQHRHSYFPAPNSCSKHTLDIQGIKFPQSCELVYRIQGTPVEI